MGNSPAKNTGKMSRREFLETSAVTMGTLASLPLTSPVFSTNLKNSSAIDTKLGVKFIVNGALHEAAYEGSCRVGDLINLSYEAESASLKESFKKFKMQLKTLQFPPEAELLEPVTMNLWIEEGNPEIMLKEEQLEKLKPDDPKTDLYVVVKGGLPQYTCLKIAERYKKPVVLARTAGWGIDMPAGLRRKGLEGFYAQSWDDLNRLIRLMTVRKAVQQTKILNVTNFFDRVPLGVVSSIIDLDFVKDHYGIDYQNVDYAEFFSEMDQVVKRKAIKMEAEKIGDKLIRNASKTNMDREDVINSVLFYLTTRTMMDKYNCNAFIIECFELCSSLNPCNRRFTPCLTHALLKDGGCPSACEKDLNALLTMMVEMYLSKKAAYMGNPDIDVKENILSLHHSDASKKLRGFDQPDSPYELKSFTKSGFGATLRYDFNRDKDEMVTVARFDPSAAKLLMTKGTILSGSGLDGYGCAQRVNIQIPDGKDFLHKQQDFGHHLTLVLGDYTEEIKRLSEIMDFEVVAVL